MSKMTMQQEIEMLRNEVARLESQQKTESAASASGDMKSQENLPDYDDDPMASIKEYAGQLEDNVEEQIRDMIETLKKDYETVSPISALLLFALGAAFGRALSSK